VTVCAMHGVHAFAPLKSTPGQNASKSNAHSIDDRTTLSLSSDPQRFTLG